MSGNQYSNDVQFAGLIQAATAAADAQARNVSVLGKRTRNNDESFIDTSLRAPPALFPESEGQLNPSGPILQSSASVLFREPSEKSKKYSRPPLGKVYTDLELAPESFLRLQNAAKAFMLDDDHPERRDVVGHKKHSSNNDVAKLRLWNCVEAFLAKDDNGTRWFGHNAGLGIPEAPQRTFFWPDDKQKITKLCMPLFRKMVTNERQRVYASETRKQEAVKNDKSRTPKSNKKSPESGTSLTQLAVDGSPSLHDQLGESLEPQDSHFGAFPESRSTNANHHLTLHINVVSIEANSSHRVIPGFTVSSASLNTLPKLLEEVGKKYDFGDHTMVADEESDFLPVVKVWLPDGLVRVKDDGQWMVSLLSAGMVDWMDSQLTVLIEV